ncbi:MAG TPA: metal-dependent hydrolase [Thermoanaerobaculia bacterium]
MDPLSQGVLGAAAAQALFNRKLKPRTWLIGAVGGVLPDADIFIRSAADPLLAVEVHRQFTHSLVFIPIGGLIAALPWLLRRTNNGERWGIYGAATVGYATHGLLDACTTYGTQLYWPFSTFRAAWHVVSILDPIFTFVLLAGVVLSALSARRLPAIIALVLALGYLSLGYMQRERALDAQESLASARGHVRTRGEVFPTIGNQLVWRSLYEESGTLHADRIRVPWFSSALYKSGTSVPAVEERDLPEEQRRDARIIRDFHRFRWFSGGWVARAPEDSTVIGDVRYSLRTDSFDPIWGVRFHPGASPPTEWVNRTRDRKLGVRALWDEIAGRGELQPIPKVDN